MIQRTLLTCLTISLLTSAALACPGGSRSACQSRGDKTQTTAILACSAKYSGLKAAACRKVAQIANKKWHRHCDRKCGY